MDVPSSCNKTQITGTVRVEEKKRKQLRSGDLALSLGGFLSFLAAHLGLRDPDKKSYILQEVPVLYLPKDHLS